MPYGSLKLIASLYLGVLTPLCAMAQSPATTQPAAIAPSAAAKPMAFDVVSIRENTGERTGPVVYGPTPNGYRMLRQPMPLILMAAYVPTQGDGSGFFNPRDIEGMPDWMLHSRFDVEARVAESDMPAWQDPAQQAVMERAMLQRMLEERLQLKVHRENREKAVFELHVGKNGPKLKPAASGELTTVQKAHAKAGQLPGGMIIVEGEEQGLMLYNASMQSLVSLPGMGLLDRPIIDKTGLIGRYDIVIKLDQSGDGGDRGTAMISALQEQLGLKLEPTKAPVEVLVVDHIEKPTAN